METEKSSRKIVTFHFSDQLNGQTFKFDKDRVVIGSVESADLRITGEGVSPIHAVVERTPTLDKAFSCTLFDLASDTGVVLNGNKIVAHPLGDSDEIEIGKHRFRYSLQEVDITDRIRKAENRALFLDPQEDLSPLLLEDEREVVEIFDYRPTSKQALEVVMSWFGVILAVEHFIREKNVTIGHHRKSDFAIPPLLSLGRFPIVTRTRGKFVLNLDSHMKGVIQKSGELKTLGDIRSGGILGPNGHEVPMENNDFAKISVGDVDFYFSFTAAPPRLKRRKILDRDPLFSKIFISSMLMTCLVLATLLKINVPQTIESEQVPERIANILYRPDLFLKAPPPPPPPKKETPPPAPKPPVVTRPTEKVAPKPVQQARRPAPQPKLQPAPQQAKQGEGKGPQGAAPKLTSTQPSANSQSRSQVSGLGSADLLKGASGRLQSIFGSIGGGNAGGEKGALQSFGNFASAGGVGSAFSGTGTGAGGKKGIGMGKVGTGLAAAGNGVGLVGSQTRIAIRTDGPEEAVVMGAIDRNAIAEAIYAHKDEFRLCYEREINAEHPHLSGQVTTQFVIGASGRVDQAGIESSSLQSPNAERCILAVLKRIVFPPPNGGGLVEVRFPFKFNSIKN